MKMINMSSIFVLLCVLSSTSGGLLVLSGGKCPNIPLKQDFDLTRYIGKWYNPESFPAPFQLGLSCIQAEYSLNTDGTVRVNNTGIRDIKIFGRSVFKKATSALGTAKVLDSNQPAGLYVTFPGAVEFDKNKPNYLILDTDYTGYSLVYSCTPFLGILKIEFAWILSRTPQKPPQTDQLKALLTRYGVNVKNFEQIDFSNC